MSTIQVSETHETPKRRLSDHFGPRRSYVSPAGEENPKTVAARARSEQALPPGIVLMTGKAVARATGLSEITIYRYAKSGRLPYIKMGGERAPRRYKLED